MRGARASANGGWVARLSHHVHHSPLRSLVVKGTRGRLEAVSHLLCGNFMNAAVMLVSVAMAARALGPATYGIMVMVLSYNRVVERVMRFESWQPVIRFAVHEEMRQSPRRMGRLYAYGLLLDTGAAAVAALCEIALAWLFGGYFHLTALHLELIAIYSVGTLCNISGVPTAALRMAGKFKLLAYTQVAANLIRIVFAGFCLAGGYGLVGFMVAWTAAQALGSLIVFAVGLHAIKGMGIPSPFRVPVKGLTRDFPGFFSFACSTNLSLTLRVITTEADSLFVGAIAGSASAAVYYLAKRIAKVAAQIGAQVQAVVYPDVARMWAKGNVRGFRAATFQVQIALAAVGLLVLAAAYVAGPLVIRLGPGEAYAPVYTLLLTQLVAVMLILHAAPSRSALLAMNRSWQVLTISTLGTVMFCITAAIAVPRLGAIGGNLAHIVMGVIVAVIMDIGWTTRSRTPARVLQPA